MESWDIQLHREAEKALRKLPKDIVSRIDNAIRSLAEDPRPPGCKKLFPYENLFRIRVGAWRIVYAVEEGQRIVLVLDITPRGRAYRNL